MRLIRPSADSEHENTRQCGNFNPSPAAEIRFFTPSPPPKRVRRLFFTINVTPLLRIRIRAGFCVCTWDADAYIRMKRETPRRNGLHRRAIGQRLVSCPAAHWSLVCLFYFTFSFPFCTRFVTILLALTIDEC